VRGKPVHGGCSINTAEDVIALRIFKDFSASQSLRSIEAVNRVGDVGDRTLVPLELCPANVALVVVADQNVPGSAILAEAAHDSLAAGLDRDTASGPPEGIGCSVDHPVRGLPK
jgi:hypothetical protein